LFCATIENAEHVAEAMCARGIYTETVDGKMPKDVREDKFERFRTGKLRGLASVGVMTTGTDIVSIDCIVLLIATKSPGKYQQIIGRGFRVDYADGYDIETKEGRIAAIANGNKPNFLTICHGGNIERHGPIINVTKPQSRKKGQRQAAPKPLARICEVCRTANTLEALSCIICGTELKIERDPTASLSLHASDADIMGTPFSRGEAAEWFDVDDVRYSRHTKGDSEMLKITYYSGIMQFDEYKFISWFGEWWAARSELPKPKSVHDALKWIETLKKPKRVQVRKKGKFYECLRYEFDEAIQSSAVSGVA
jgi:DNA repair protein RadD